MRHRWIGCVVVRVLDAKLEPTTGAGLVLLDNGARDVPAAADERHLERPTLRRLLVVRGAEVLADVLRREIDRKL